MKIVNMVKEHFNNSRKEARESAGISEAQLNNAVSLGAEVLELKDGSFIIKRSNSVIFKTKLNNSCVM